MKHLIRIVILFVVIAQPVALALADGDPKLTLAQMRSARVVADGRVESRLVAGPAAVYRLAECQTDVCYFSIAQVMSYSPLVDSATLSCGIDIYNNVGVQVARLKQNINVTFWNNINSPPLTLNWGDSRGTESFCCWYEWTSLGEPVSNPSWGVYVGPEGTAWSNLSGVLTYAPPLIFPTQRSVSSRWRLDGQGLHCE